MKWNSAIDLLIHFGSKIPNFSFMKMAVRGHGEETILFGDFLCFHMSLQNDQIIAYQFSIPS